MTPNRKERLLDTLVSWSGVSLRSGDFVKLFAWCREIPSSRAWASGVLVLLKELSGHVPGGLRLGAADQPGVELSSADAESLRLALQEKNALDESMGGAVVRSHTGDVSVSIEWSADVVYPLTTVQGAFAETWLDRKECVVALASFAKGLARAIGAEYLLVSHISDERRRYQPVADFRKRIEAGQLGPVPRYDSKPARCLPYVPWLLILGPAYVRFFGSAVRGLDGVEWVDDLALIRSADSPLDYGTPEAARREAKTQDILGREAFFDPGDPYRIAKGPEFPDGYKRWPHKSNDTPGVIWDAYPSADGVKVSSRRAGK